VAMCGMVGFGLAVALAGVHAQSATVHDCEFLPVDAVRVSG
jgi:hypothetical protein